MERPKIDLQKEPVDRVLEVSTFLAVGLLIGLPILNFNSLPDTIPTHFNGLGVADGYGSKGMILVMPIIGTLLFIGLYALSRVPHIFTYSVEITQENAEKHYRNGTKLMRWLNLIIVVAFSFIEWRIIDSATEAQSTLGSYFMPVFLAAIFGTISVFIWKSRN